MARRLIDSPVGQRLKQPVQRALGGLGWELRRRDGHHGASLAGLLRRYGVTQVLDVGANVGQFATQLRLDGFGGSIVSFEPNPRAFAQLERATRGDAAWSGVLVAAGGAEGTTTLHVTANSTSSSVLDLTPEHVAAAPESAVTGTVEVRVRRIDDVWHELGSDAPLLLKLDVQGFELAALEGAPDVLRAAALVKTELSFVELFAGQASYLQVLGFMAEAGFVPIDVEPGFRDPASGRLLQSDVLFARPLASDPS